MYYNTGTTLLDELLIGMIVASIGVFFILAILLNFYLPFKKDRDYIKMEMERSYGVDEYRYWKRELKQLYLHSIPLIGRFFR